MTVSYSTSSSSNSISPGHSENQDSYLADIANLVFAVADGVGGYEGGKIASQLAIDTLSSYAHSIQDDLSMKSALEEIHERVRRRAKSLHYENMGTTIAAVKLVEGPDFRKAIVGNVGDSSVILFRNETLKKTVENEEKGSPESGRSFDILSTDDSHRKEDPRSMWGITQYLGLEDLEIDYHSTTFDYSSGDLLLVCSDGITDNLLNPAFGVGMKLPELVRKYRSADKVVEQAIQVGIKPDDMTAVLIAL
jgi:PPM family protein phosphatase